MQGRQLASITTGGKTYAYSYDGDGIRTQKIVDGVAHTYVTQNGKVMRETIGSGTTAKVLDFIYDNTGKPFALRYSTNGGSSYATYYYVLNLQGDVVKLVRIYAGTTIQEYEEMASYTYNAWGEIISSSGSMADINPLRYRGYYYDAETGFYYLQSRYYDPANCRFINADGYASTGTGFLGCNMFAYCNNNPVNHIDDAGSSPLNIRGFSNQMSLGGEGAGDGSPMISQPPSKTGSNGKGFEEQGGRKKFLPPVERINEEYIEPFVDAVVDVVEAVSVIGDVIYATWGLANTLGRTKWLRPIMSTIKQTALRVCPYTGTVMMVVDVYMGIRALIDAIEAAEAFWGG